MPKQTIPPNGRSPFGELLLNLRTNRGLTQEGLSQATHNSQVSSRSITYYEKRASSPKNWVLPHRTGLRFITDALNLDDVDRRALVIAWTNSKSIKTLQENKTLPEDPSSFIDAGREAAISTIMNAWHRTKSGSPQAVFVGGIMGIGKTQLMRHISDLIAESTNPVMITWGSASSWATSVEPYLAIRTATDRILVEPPATTTVPGVYPSRPVLTRKHIERVLDSMPQLGGALISERAIRALADANPELDPESVDTLLLTRSGTEQVGRIDEYAHLIIELAHSWPLVIVLEDLHWIGEPTATLLLHLARQLEDRRDTPILLIGTYRNDEVYSAKGEEHPPFGRVLNTIGHVPNITMVKLNDSMAEPEGMAFIRALLRQFPMKTKQEAEQLATWLYAQTSGHPLMTGEILRHLLDTKVLSQDIGESLWSMSSDKLPKALPLAISSFVEQRLNKVSRKGRRVLEIASVMDDVILTEIIAEIMEIDDDDLLQLIDEQLVHTHQLLLPGTPIDMAREAVTSYRFPHAVFREHIYSNLPSSRRKNLHRAVAEKMENRFTDPDSQALGEITSHYVLAEDWHSAQMAGYRLAQEATIRLDWDRATLWFEQAEDLAMRAHDPHQLWRTRAARLAVLRGLDQFSDALEMGERIVELAEVHNWPATLALAKHHMAEVHYDLGQVDKAVELLEAAIELHLKDGMFDLAAAGEAMISHGTYRQGKYDVALKHARKALEYSRDLHNSWVHPEAILAAANCETDLGFYEQAIANYEVAIELAIMIGKLSNQFIPAMNIALCNIQLGNNSTAIRDLKVLIDQMGSYGIFKLSSYAIQYLGYAYEGAGLWDDARITYAKATKMRRTRSAAPVLYDSVAGQLRIAIQQNDIKLIESSVTEITAQMDEEGWEGMEDPLLVMLSVATAYAHLRDIDGYRTYIERAHALLMERANMIEEPASSQSYLTNVPVNLELQKRFAEL